MKNLFLLFASFLVAHSVTAQNIEIRILGEMEDISGTVLTLESPGEYSVVGFQVVNYLTPQILNIRRKIITPLPGTQDAFCWHSAFGEGICYDYETVSASNPFTSTCDPFVGSEPDYGDLVAEHKGNGIGGFVQYRYIVVDELGNSLDSVDLAWTSTASLQKPTESEVNSVFPDRLADVLVVKQMAESGTITIYDLSGKAICSQALSAGQTNVPMPTSNSGIYFYHLLAGGKSTTGKFAW